MTRYIRMLLVPAALACNGDSAEPATRAGAAAGERAAATLAVDTPDSRGSVSPPAGLDLSPGDSVPEEWKDISVASVNRRGVALPLKGEVAGPSVVEAQTLLDRTRFSPGVIDGYWGKNTRMALSFFQEQNGLEGTGTLDEATYRALLQVTGDVAEQVVKRHRLTSQDVAGPFVSLPEDVYERAEMECLCYESLSEKLGERFHTTPEVLSQLNPGVELNGLSAGDEISVPNIRDVPPGGKITQLVVSDAEHYVQALDGQGEIVYHFPSTLGSQFSPSPSGEFRVTNIAWDPEWHYQPELLEGPADHEPEAVLPAGPNNAVGVVWMQLSKEHYGIHGTSAPETIGHVTSNGCVRLTNWDARLLADNIDPGVPVQFTDVT